MAEKIKINDQITAPEVRLITEIGEQVGVIKLDEAKSIADKKDLDLVEVAPQAKPPVCRIMDYAKYKYEQEQKAKKTRKHQTAIVVKEMKLRPKIDPHDYETKKRHVLRFLKSGSKVKITIMFRGREMVHTELGGALLDKLVEDLKDVATVESKPKLDGRNMIMVLNPIQAKPENIAKASV